MIKYAVTFLMAVVASTPLPAAETRGMFEWFSLLGKASQEANDKLSNIATCGAIAPLTTTVPIISRNTTVRRDLERPISGSLVRSRDLAPVEHISTEVTTAGCTIDEAAKLRLYYFRDRLFRIDLSYFLCDWHIEGKMCRIEELEEKSYDISLYEAIRHKTAYSITGSPPQTTTYFEVYSDYLNETATMRLLFESECEAPRVVLDAQHSYRCIVDASMDDEYWHSVSMFEFYERALFDGQVIGRFSHKQSFIMIGLEEAALDILTQETQKFVDEAIFQLLANERAQQRREEEIDNLLGGESR